MPQLRFFCFCCVLNHAQDVVHRKGKVLFGLKPAYRQILRQAVDCKNRFYAFLIGAFYAKIRTANYSDYVPVLLLRPTCYADDNLAAEALGVELAFTGKDIVGVPDHVIKRHRVKDGLNSHLKS